MLLKYANNGLSELGLQLALSPRHLRLKQLAGIDRLLDLVDPEKSYPYDLVHFHLTGTRPTKANQEDSIRASHLLSDLPTLAEQITRKVCVSLSDMEGDYQTLEGLSASLEVSTKTLRRWRSRGLLGIRATGADGVCRLVFSAKAVQRFSSRNRELVARGASFKLLTEAEKRNIVELARSMLTERRRKLHQVGRAISAQTGRAVETIRYTLRQYDAAHPEDALFARNGEPVVSAGHLAIWRCRRNGESVDQIAAAYGTDAASIEAVLRELEARQLKSEPVEFVDHELFHATDAEELIVNVARPAAPESGKSRIRAPKDLPAYLRSLYDQQLLTREQEADLFRRYNYARYRVARAVDRLDVYAVTPAELDQIRYWQSQVESLKNELIQANLRLVVSIARKHVGRGDQFFEIVSDGNMSLMRAIDKFDFSLGNKFSTYASWSIMKNYARSIPGQHYHLRRYVTGQDELLDATADRREPERSQSDVEAVRSGLSEGIEQLTEREQTIVKEHFGLFNPDGAVATLEELGKRFGVTKERVRQIEQRAIGKLRELISPSLLEAFAD